MKVLLTGSTGFLGKAIQQVFSNEDIITLGRNKCDIIADITIDNLILPVVDAVIHAAGRAHLVPKNKKEIDSFFLVNVKGTANLLSALENNLPKYFLYISTVAVYGKTSGILINETEELRAIDPYGKSKADAERLVEGWCKKNNVQLCILRLPLLVGVNPPGNLKAMIKAINKGYYFNIAGGKTCKSMVLIQDVAAIIPKALQVGGIYNLTDGLHPSFAQLSYLIANQLNKRQPVSLPFWFAKILSIIGDIIGKRAIVNSEKFKKITSNLTFDDTKAKKILDWSPNSVLNCFNIF